MPPSYSTFQMTHKTCVARQTCNIFICWPYLTWPWPWPLLTIRPILTHNFLQPLRSLSAKFGFADIISHISVADKAKSDRFDLWPDLDLACDLLKKFVKIPSESTRWELSIAASPASLRLLLRELAGGRGIFTLPPPLARRVRPETPALRRLKNPGSILIFTSNRSTPLLELATGSLLLFQIYNRCYSFWVIIDFWQNNAFLKKWVILQQNRQYLKYYNS